MKGWEILSWFPPYCTQLLGLWWGPSCGTDPRKKNEEALRTDLLILNAASTFITLHLVSCYIWKWSDSIRHGICWISKSTMLWNVLNIQSSIKNNVMSRKTSLIVNSFIIKAPSLHSEYYPGCSFCYSLSFIHTLILSLSLSLCV